MITRIELKKGNRMVRAGFGQYKYRWFFRVDLWWVAYRINRKPA
jgi:hypothetical protein